MSDPTKILSAADVLTATTNALAIAQTGATPRTESTVDERRHLLGVWRQPLPSGSRKGHIV